MTQWKAFTGKAPFADAQAEAQFEQQATPQAVLGAMNSMQLRDTSNPLAPLVRGGGLFIGIVNALSAERLIFQKLLDITKGGPIMRAVNGMQSLRALDGLS